MFSKLHHLDLDYCFMAGLYRNMSFLGIFWTMSKRTVLLKQMASFHMPCFSVAGRLQGGPLPCVNGVTLLTLICRGRDVFRLSPLLQPKNPGIPHVLFRWRKHIFASWTHVKEGWIQCNSSWEMFKMFSRKNRDFPQNKSPEFVAGFLLTHMVRGCYIYLYSSLKTINQIKAAKVQLLEVDKENIMRHVFYDDKLCARSPRPFPPLLFFSVSSQ